MNQKCSNCNDKASKSSMLISYFWSKKSNVLSSVVENEGRLVIKESFGVGAVSCPIGNNIFNLIRDFVNGD